MLDNSKTESQYNVALEYLKRSVQRAFDMCTECSLQRDCDGWFNALGAVHRGISPKTSDEEDKDIEKSYLEIGDLMRNKINIIKKKGRILYMLHKQDMKLRKIAQKKGMLLPSRDNPGEAILDK